MRVSGLRESKKAATRTALSRAAAQLALTDGPEGLTVAAIAAASGVSPRTFHNYFSSREEALMEFINEQVQNLLEQLNALPEEMDALAAVEHIVINHLRHGDSQLDSFGALFHIGEVIESLSSNPPMPDTNHVIKPLLPSISTRFPHLDEFEATVAIHVLASAIRVALEWFYQGPEPRDPEVGVALVHRACKMLRIA